MDEGAGGGLNLAKYYVHGTQYVDERAVVNDEVNDREYYYYLDDLYTVGGLVTDLGHEAERYTYDAYGKPVLHIIPVEEYDGNGVVGPGDTERSVPLFGGALGSSLGKFRTLFH